MISLFARIRLVEQRLAAAEQERVATALLRGSVHTLGNALQIVDLASAELVRREHDDHDRLLSDLRGAAIEARDALGAMVSLARPAPRTARGPAVAPVVRATIEALRAVVPAIDVDIAIDDATATRLAADELDALVLAAALDAATATLRFTLGVRTISGVRWLELVRHDDRPGAFVLDLTPPSLVAVVDQIARLVGGEVSLAPGRDGHELAIALPVAEL